MRTAVVVAVLVVSAALLAGCENETKKRSERVDEYIAYLRSPIPEADAATERHRVNRQVVFGVCADRSGFVHESGDRWVVLDGDILDDQQIYGCLTGHCRNLFAAGCGDFGADDWELYIHQQYRKCWSGFHDTWQQGCVADLFEPKPDVEACLDEMYEREHRYDDEQASDCYADRFGPIFKVRWYERDYPTDEAKAAARQRRLDQAKELRRWMWQRAPGRPRIPWSSQRRTEDRPSHVFGLCDYRYADIQPLPQPGCWKNRYRHGRQIHY